MNPAIAWLDLLEQSGKTMVSQKAQLTEETFQSAARNPNVTAETLNALEFIRSTYELINGIEYAVALHRDRVIEQLRKLGRW